MFKEYTSIYKNVLCKYVFYKGKEINYINRLVQKGLTVYVNHQNLILLKVHKLKTKFTNL